MNKYRFDYIKIRRKNILESCIAEYKSRFNKLCKQNADARGVKSTVYNSAEWKPNENDIIFAQSTLKITMDEINAINDIDKATDIYVFPWANISEEEGKKMKEKMIEDYNVTDNFKWYDKLNYVRDQIQNRYETFMDLYYRDENNNPTLRYSVMDDRLTNNGYLFGKGNLRADYRNYGYKFSGDKENIINDIYDSVLRWEENNPYMYDELKEYLDNLPLWDGVERLDRLFVKYQKAPDIAYVRKATRNWFINAVRQVYMPCVHPFLGMLVLHGETDCGKTATLEHMFQINGEDRFTYNIDMRDSQQKIASILRTKWALGFGERVGIAKDDNNVQKQFMDTINATISYQKKFQNEVTNYKPHNCVYISSNDKTLLNDYTVAYNKRYLIIPCHITAKEYQDMHYWQETKDIKDQIWAEALYYFNLDNNQRLFLSDDEINELIGIQADYQTIDESDIDFAVEELLKRDWNYEEPGNYRVLKNEEDFVEQFRKGPVITEGSKYVGKLNCFPATYIKKWMKMKDMDSRMKKMVKNAFEKRGWTLKQVYYYNAKCWCKELKNDQTDEFLG